MTSEYQLFILWERARYQQEKILADMRGSFAIVRQYEITWTPELVSSNYTRFYGENLPDHSEKEQECGVGAFLLVVVRDEHPQYASRETSHGEEEVNVNMFDKKALYREWTGGGHKIHCSNTSWEFNHDITLLLGLNANDFKREVARDNSYRDEIKRVSRDIVGANGWNSLEDLLYVLNATVNYAVMRGEEWLSMSQSDTSVHGDIDVLLEKCQNAIQILNGSYYCESLHPHILVSISGQEYIFDLWGIGQGVFDELWEREMLDNRVLRGSYYVLSEKDDFYSLLYHCLIHKNTISPDYQLRLAKYKEKLAICEQNWNQILADYLSKKSYVVPLENDAGVEVNLDEAIMHSYAYKYGALIKRLCEEVNNKVYVSVVFEKEQSFVKKGTPWLIDNETRFLKQLEQYPQFPHIVAEGADEEEKWIEIKRVEGVDIEHYFKTQLYNNTPKRVGSFLNSILSILKVLQEEHIVHRDFMPSNLLIHTNTHGRCEVGLIDFGWAIYDYEQDNCITPTMLGGDYASKPIRSDIYSCINILREYWPHIQAVYRVIDCLQRGDAVDTIKVHFTLRDYFVLFVMRHKQLKKVVRRICKKLKS